MILCSLFGINKIEATTYGSDKITYYETRGWNGLQITGTYKDKLAGHEYHLEYWPYKEKFVNIHNKALEKKNLITSSNGYIELQNSKTNKVPDGVQDGILVKTYEWRIGVIEKTTPILGDDGKNAEISSSLTK